MCDISIVIVSWNARDYLRGCLHSIANCRAHSKLQVIVVDNDSRDGSPEMVEREFPSVRLIRTGRNIGFAAGNNVGIRASRGRYVFLVNSDVVILSGCLDKLRCFLDDHPKVGLTGPRVLNADRSLQLSCRRLPTPWNSFCRMLALDSAFPNSKFFQGWRVGPREHDTTKPVEVLSGCFWAARRTAIDAVGLLDEGYFMYAEDIDWCKRFKEGGWQVYYTNESEAVHFGGASSGNQPERFFIEMHRADLRYWRKHHGRIGAAYYALIILGQQILRIVPRSMLYAFVPSRRGTNAPHIRRSAACLQWLFGLSGASRS
jgi:GT2 family glycosyltransferase